MGKINCISWNLQEFSYMNKIMETKNNFLSDKTDPLLALEQFDKKLAQLF